MAIPLSVLDLALLGTRASSADALRGTTEVARRADELGYHRFWVAEHHNSRSVASTSPAVLIAHLAAATSRIRVGSGGVMLPNHPALVVAEQFAMLEALHPGRIDLGIGRAPGTDPATASALRRAPAALTDAEFPRYLQDLLGLLGDPRTSEGIWDGFSATPAARTSPGVVLLGSSDFSARLAGRLGLPYAYAHHFSTGATLPALRLYRETFTPSAVLAEPYAIVTINVLTADSDDEAAWLAAPHRVRVLEMLTGRSELLLLTPEAAAAHPHLDKARRLPINLITGAPDTVTAGLAALAEQTAADELMVLTESADVATRLRSFELLARAWSPAAEILAG
ncbi:LLM class flavin-dependent oxidoreductase [Amycolatopsis sp. NPDC004378]